MKGRRDLTPEERRTAAQDAKTKPKRDRDTFQQMVNMAPPTGTGPPKQRRPPKRNRKAPVRSAPEQVAHTQPQPIPPAFDMTGTMLWPHLVGPAASRPLRMIWPHRDGPTPAPPPYREVHAAIDTILRDTPDSYRPAQRDLVFRLLLDLTNDSAGPPRHADEVAKGRYRLLLLRAGQCLFSLPFLAKKLGITVSRAQRLINTLERKRAIHLMSPAEPSLDPPRVTAREDRQTDRRGDLPATDKAPRVLEWLILRRIWHDDAQ